MSIPFCSLCGAAHWPGMPHVDSESEHVDLVSGPEVDLVPTSDAIKRAEQRGYARGYAAGMRRRQSEV